MEKPFSGDLFQCLRGFAFSAETGSVSRAAELMGRTQAAVSQQIARLEDELGFKVFSRRGGRIELTVEGEKVLALADDVFNALARMREIGAASDSEASGEVSIGVANAFYNQYYSALRSFAASKTPGMKLTVQAMLHREILVRVREGTVDFGLGFSDHITPELNFEKLFESEIFLLAPKGDVNPALDHPDIDTFSRLPLITLVRESNLYQVVGRHFAVAGLTFSPVLDLNNAEGIKLHVLQGDGYAILDECNYRPEEPFSRHSLSHLFPPRPTGIITRRDTLITPQARSFCNHIRKLGKDVLAPDIARDRRP